MTDIILRIDGEDFKGWKEIEITRSIEQIAGQFSFGLSDRWPDLIGSKPVRAGATAEVIIDGQTVITGHVDAVDITHNREDHSIRVSGRDAAGDLVDCSALEPLEMLDVDLASIVAALAAPFGISVEVQADIGGNFARFAIQTSETVFEAIERACRQRGVLPISDGKGGLILWQAGGNTSNTSLVLGQNILGGRINIDYRDRFSKYILRGQSEGDGLSADAVQSNSGGWDEESQINSEAIALDNQITRHRPLLVIAENQTGGQGLQARVDWQRDIAAGRSVLANIQVQGWHDQQTLWTPGFWCFIQHELFDLYGALIISTVKFTLSRNQGSITELSLMPKDAFSLLPEGGETRVTETDAGGWG